MRTVKPNVAEALADLYQNEFGKSTTTTTTGFNWSKATRPTPEDEPPFTHSVKPFYEYLNNDLGLADLLADRVSNRLRFARGIGWLAWDGTVWRCDAIGEAVQITADIARESVIEALALRSDDERLRAGKAALALGHRTKIENVLKLAESHKQLVVKPSQLDTDPMMVTCLNGTINLVDGSFEPPNPAHLITRQLGVAYDPDAACPRWERFLLEAMDGDADTVEFLRRWVGYMLTGSMKEQVFAFFYGTGGNGKSKFVETIQAMFGTYASRASESLFESKTLHKDSRNEIAELPGIRALFASETTQGGKLNERLIKDITGGEPLRGEAKYKAGFVFTPCCKILISGNYEPTIHGTDSGIWRRVMLVPFNVKFEGEHKDLGLGAALMAELPGILRWSIEGAVRWYRDGLTHPAAIQRATASYREDQDTLADFIRDHLVEVAGGNVLKSAVFEAYTKWCAGCGIRYLATIKGLNRQLKQRGIWDDGSKYWRGLSLVNTTPFNETNEG